jgi:hypothetical protein
MPPKSNGEHPINGVCAVCGYRLQDWQLIVGRKHVPHVDYARALKVFS